MTRWTAKTRKAWPLGWTAQGMIFCAFVNTFRPVLTYFVTLSVAMGAVAHVTHLVLYGIAGVQVAAAHALGYVPAACQAVILPSLSIATLLGARNLGASGEALALSCIGGPTHVTCFPALVIFGLAAFSLVPLCSMLERSLERLIQQMSTFGCSSEVQAFAPIWEPKVDGSTSLTVIMQVGEGTFGKPYTLGAHLGEDAEMILYARNSPDIDQGELVMRDPKIYVFSRREEGRVDVAVGTATAVSLNQSLIPAIGTRCPLPCCPQVAFLCVIFSIAGYLFETIAWTSRDGFGPLFPWQTGLSKIPEGSAPARGQLYARLSPREPSDDKINCTGS